MVAFSGLPAATTFGETDIFAIEQGGVSKKLTKTQLRALLLSDPAFAVPLLLPQNGDIVSYNGTDFIAGENPRWRVINPAAYQINAVTNVSQITFGGGASPTSGIYRRANDYFAIGTPVRVVIGSTTYYGICSAVTNTTLTIQGPPLQLSTTIVSVSAGTPDMVKQVPIYVGKAAYATTVADQPGTFRWRGRTGYLVSFAAAHATTGVPKVNVKCNNNLVSTADTTKGIQLSSTPGTFVETAAATISLANYAIADSQNVVVRVTEAVASQDYLSMTLLFVVP